MNLTIFVRTGHRGIRIVDITGEVDLYSSALVNSALSELIDDGHVSLLINLENVRYIDSTGLGMLIGALQRVRLRGGRLDLICSDLFMCKLFDITGIAKSVTIFRDERTAIGTFG